jgi:hypothetical protein
MKVKNVICKDTGRRYDPIKEFDKILNSPENVAVMKRLKVRS